MNVRFFCLSAALWAAACGISDSVEFGPSATPSASAGENANGGGAGAGTAAGGKSGAATAGKGGVASGGATSQPTSGASGASTAGKPSTAGGAGDGAGGAAGDSGMVAEPVCGNGVIETGEQCDAGSPSDHDGCDECRVVCAEHGDDLLESDDHHCYAGYREPQLEFASAREDCEMRGAHLVTIESAAENELVAEFIVESKYIGAFEDVALTAEGSGDYRWVTGEALSFENWANGEPDRAESRCGEGPGPGPGGSRCYEHCVAILSDGRWADQRCDRADGWVWEGEPVGRT